MISANAELLSECSIGRGLEQEYQKYNVLSTEDLTRHFFTTVHSLVLQNGVRLHFSDNINSLYMVDYNSTLIIAEILKCGYYRYYVVVQFYPWFKFSFLLFETLYYNLLLSYITIPKNKQTQSLN